MYFKKNLHTRVEVNTHIVLFLTHAVSRIESSEQDFLHSFYRLELQESVDKYKKYMKFVKSLFKCENITPYLPNRVLMHHTKEHMKSMLRLFTAIDADLILLSSKFRECHGARKSRKRIHEHP